MDATICEGARKPFLCGLHDYPSLSIGENMVASWVAVASSTETSSHLPSHQGTSLFPSMHPIPFCFSSRMSQRVFALASAQHRRKDAVGGITALFFLLSSDRHTGVRALAGVLLMATRSNGSACYLSDLEHIKMPSHNNKKTDGNCKEEGKKTKGKGQQFNSCCVFRRRWNTRDKDER